LAPLGVPALFLCCWFFRRLSGMSRVWMDDVMIERLWRLLKKECVYLRKLEAGSDLRNPLAWWFDFYNNRRPYKTFDDISGLRAA